MTHKLWTSAILVVAVLIVLFISLAFLTTNSPPILPLVTPGPSGA